MEIEDGVSLKEINRKEDGLIASATVSLMMRSDLIVEAVFVALIPYHFFPVPFPENAPKELLKYIPNIQNQLK